MTGYVHPQLHEEIVERLKLELEAANVQARFWRQAAEHAVDGWNALEDKYDAAIEAIGDCLEKCDLPLAQYHALETIYNAATPIEAEPDVEPKTP